MEKPYKLWKFSTIKPENPANIFPKNAINEVNNAYWNPVYFWETKLVKKVILTVPTIPAAILSEATIKAKRVKFLSLKAA